MVRAGAIEWKRGLIRIVIDPHKSQEKLLHMLLR